MAAVLKKRAFRSWKRPKKAYVLSPIYTLFSTPKRAVCKGCPFRLSLTTGNPRRGFPAKKQSTGLFFLPSCGFYPVSFSVFFLKNQRTPKGTAFGIRKPLKRLDPNFMIWKGLILAF